MNVGTGPIPGENYTSDQRNYPWHRPPEYTDLDDCLEIAAKKILNRESSRSLVTMMEMGVPITALTSAFVLSGIGGGKWTPDYALLLAGPVSHIMVLLAKGNKIEYNLGINEKVAPPTSTYFKELEKDAAKIRTKESIMPDVEKRMDDVKETQGFLQMAKQMASEVEIPQQTSVPMNEGEI